MSGHNFHLDMWGFDQIPPNWILIDGELSSIFHTILRDLSYCHVFIRQVSSVMQELIQQHKMVCRLFYHYPVNSHPEYRDCLYSHCGTCSCSHNSQKSAKSLQMLLLLRQA